MNTIHAQLAARPSITRMITIAMIAALVGAAAGVAPIYAEYLSNQYVPQAGNVATVGTTGYSSGGTLYASGLSYSTTSLYYISAWIRIWHQSAGYNILQAQHLRTWQGFGGWTDQIQSSGYGDRAVTQSIFQYSQISQQAYYYTSYPGTTGSCYTYWNSGYNC